MTIGKLGRLPTKHDDRTLQLARYLSVPLPTPPAACDWTAKVRKAWGEMKNDQIGDCTIAALGHSIMTWTANAGTCVKPTDAQVVKAYAAVSGYDPKTGANDNGATCLDVLNYARKTGLGGHKIAAYVKLTPKNLVQLREAIGLFGAVYFGADLPLSAQDQIDRGQAWDVPEQGPAGRGRAGTWGGHAICAVAYQAGQCTVITWGQPQVVTDKFYAAYVDEAYAVLTPDWIDKAGASPGGFNLSLLQSDLAAITNG